MILHYHIYINSIPILTDLKAEVVKEEYIESMSLDAEYPNQSNTENGHHVKEKRSQQVGPLQSTKSLLEDTNASQL